ncbi:precorrin-3B C(17)-methyltransferase [Acidisoma cellulosilytica]|uniref:Precorrin-3B C(17)-methyltransferase n=1 Tax=Acidisoma cellulosilyticum TaxID=2802395 RepID=A0A964E2N4_9PROT|nr:precorrin-3B C(17)-methyltransferase [Acidisoma cellulosilyticum]MCB8879810.1 precorrin-3B C(17)-methyltransferase [Acidisoma cellulosilyticum]
MKGALYVIGLGPGDAGLVTPEASAALARCTDVFGYFPYVARVPERPGLTRHASDNREEIARARAALVCAASGGRVAVVSGGDPGVFAMASAVFEAVESGPAEWRALDIQVLPGISAMLAAAARVGAPLGHDFAVLSLSDNLKPWDLVLHRVRAAASAGFALALYNPISRVRPWQLGAALMALTEILPSETPVIFASAVTRPDERIEVLTLTEAAGAPERADMRTMVIIGTAETRRIARGNGHSDWIYAPRSVGPLPA